MSLPSGNQDRRPWYRPSLTVRIMIGFDRRGDRRSGCDPIGETRFFFWRRPFFLNLIKNRFHRAACLLNHRSSESPAPAPLRKVGRMGVKALVYFEIATTAALCIGLAVVNFMKPGEA